ncbi:MAG TPA: VOC family protein [Candidatus Thermoplasmatota archaeon]|nr:VOC family protein [Candidatus Thermoplasmatota archaeon]
MTAGWRLAYLYVGSSRFADDLAYYRDVLRAPLAWNLEGFGAHVAAFRFGEGPLVLLADHRPAGTCMPVYAVPDLEATVSDLRLRGWSPRSGPFEIPPGPCYTFADPSGNEVAIYEEVRPRPFEE